MSDMSFVEVPVASSASALTDRAIDYLRAAYPNWQPQEGSLSVRQLEAVGPLAQNSAQVAALVPGEIFRKFGTDMFGLAYSTGARARASTTWVVSDLAGHTIEADTTAIAINGFAFTVETSVVIEAGQSQAVNVPVIAVDEGSAQNDLSTPVDLISVPDWVDLVTVAGTTSGGADPETDPAYRNRLSTLLTLMTLAPVTEQQFALMARFAGIQIGRSMAVEGYNPDDQTYDNGRYMYVAVTNPVGGELDSTGVDTIESFLRGRREANFVINVNNHTYTTVNVIYDVVGYATVDDAALEDAVEASINSYLDSLTWSAPLSQSVGGAYANDNVVRVDKLIAVIDNTPGVSYTTSVTIADADGLVTPEANGDLIMPGVAPLPTPGTLTRA